MKAKRTCPLLKGLTKSKLDFRNVARKIFTHKFPLHRRGGVVKFVQDHVPAKVGVPLVRPKASPPLGKPLTSFQDIVKQPKRTSGDSNISTPDLENQDQMDVREFPVGDNKQETGVHFFHVGDKDDLELSEIAETLGQSLSHDLDESETSNMQFLGVVEDRQEAIFTLPKTKRVLSFNTLAALDIDAGRGEEATKRTRSDLKKFPGMSRMSLLSNFSLGSSALQYPVAVRTLREVVEMSPVLDSSTDEADDEEALDRQLGDELDTPKEEDPERENTPVPLLTPPSSPLTIQVDESTRLQYCEWPSNLVVDSALVSISELRPLSPASLENLERDEEARFPLQYENDVTTLTPLLRGIYVD